MNIEEFKKVGRYLFEMGLVGSHSGNMSVRQGESIFITKRGAMLPDLKDEDIVEVGLAAGDKDPLASIELPVHRAIYLNTGVGAIVHAHPQNAVVLSLSEGKIIPIDSEGQSAIKAVPVVKVRQAIGSEEVARLLPPIFSSGYLIAIVKGHGSFAVGKSLEEALMRTSAFEHSSKIITLSRMLGGRPARPEGIERRRTAIPPSIGVMDRSRYGRRER
ncbi:MAG: aldolase [Candidatus Saganbacteria bacterium]|nr:aldolase [Candidatus Saganbacteria bacterium]